MHVRTVPAVTGIRVGALARGDELLHVSAHDRARAGPTLRALRHEHVRASVAYRVIEDLPRADARHGPQASLGGLVEDRGAVGSIAMVVAAACLPPREDLEITGQRDVRSA